MKSKFKLNIGLGLIGVLILACSFTIPTNVPLPTGIPELPTFSAPENPPPEENPPAENPPPQNPTGGPIPVTGDGIDNQTLLFFGFLALLAVIVMLGLVGMVRRQEKPHEHEHGSHDHS